jgi:hypothetical protein
MNLCGYEARAGQAAQPQGVGGAADKAANLMRCKSSVVNCPVRTTSISDVEGGNMLYVARMEKPRLPSWGRNEHPAAGNLQ